MASIVDALDFTPLTEPVSRADVQGFKIAEFDSGKPAIPKIAMVILIFVAVTFAGAGIIFFKLLSTLSYGFLIGVIIAFIFALIITALIAASYRNKKKLAKLYKFATRNDLIFSHNINAPNYAGIIFNEGNARLLEESLVFPGGIEIGNYEYATGSGEERQTHYWGYVRIKLARHLPNMILDAKSNNSFRVISNLPGSFSKNQKLGLEGDFDNYFTLYAPAEYKTDALYVFTPDVMAAVIDSGTAYDMEVVDDELMIYSGKRFSLTSPDELKGLLGIAEKIGSEIRKQSDYYADERVANRSENVVAEPGRRLKKRVSWLLIGIIILAVIYNLLHIIGVFRSNF